MTAPALVLLAHGSEESRVEQVMHALRRQLQMQRPELSVNLAFLEHCPPSGPQVVSALVARGVTEIVFVPLELTRAIDPSPEAEAMLARVRTAHPGLHAILSRPLGPASELLNVLDLRLRNALSANHALELDGLVLSVPCAGDVRGNALISRRARQWSTHHKLPALVAVGDSAGSQVASAISSLREQGRRNIAVGSFYLAGDHHFSVQVDRALASGAIAVSAPLACDERILALVMARYAFASMDLLDLVERDNNAAAERISQESLASGH